MKKIFSIFLLLLVLSSILSMNVSAMYTNELYDNIANEEIRNNLPDINSLTYPNAFILLYNNKTNQYFYFRNYRTNYAGKFRINSNTDMLTFDNGTNNCQFRGYYYDSASSKWILYSDSEGKSIFDEINVADYSYIKVINTNLLVDDKTFDINENGKIEVDGVEQEPPASSEEDSSGIINSITNFFKKLFEPILALINFIISLFEIIGKFFEKIYSVLSKIPDFFKSLDVLFSPDGDLLSKFKSMFPDNEYSKSLFSLLYIFLAYTIYKIITSIVKMITLKDK